MGKRVVDDASLSGLADYIRMMSNGTNKLVFPESFTEGVDNVWHNGYSKGRDDFLANKSIGAYYNDQIRVLSMYAFAGRSTLTSVTLPNLVGSSTAIFYYCSSLVSASLPLYGNSYSMSRDFFNGCTNLNFVDFGYVEEIQSNTFYSCKALTTIVLRRNTVVPLTYISAFDRTPFVSGAGGQIYVPANLVEQYEAATNWSALFGYGVEFLPIEGSEYE